MIKNNKFSEDSILKAEYRNRLREYGQNLHDSKISEQSKGISERSKNQISEKSKYEISERSKNGISERNKNQESKLVDDDEIKSNKSQPQRKTSVQRAFNSRVTSQLIKNEEKKISTQSNVNRLYSLERENEEKQAEQQKLSQSMKIEKSQSDSELKMQLERLNSLRNEYQILRQVSSDIEYQQKDHASMKRSNIRNQQIHHPQRMYTHESGESCPVDDTRNKKMNRKSKIKKNFTQQSTDKNIVPISHNNRAAWNLQKKQNIPSSDQQNQIQIQYRQQKLKPQNVKGSEKGSKIRSTRLISKDLSQVKSQNEQLMMQVSSLQLALTQSSLKIEQLLVQGMKNKEKLRQYQQIIQRNHKLQNQLKLSKETQKFMKRQINLKEDEINRFQKRTKLMKETIQMLQKETELKDNQIKALQNVINNYRNSSNKSNKFNQKNYSYTNNNSSSYNNPNTYSNLNPFTNLNYYTNPLQNPLQNKNLVQNENPQTINQALDRIKQLTDQNLSLKAQLHQQHSRTQVFNQQLKKSSNDDTQHIRDYFTQTNNHLKELLEKSQQQLYSSQQQLYSSQQQLYSLQSQNQKLISQLQQQQSKNMQLKETLSSKEMEIISLSESNSRLVQESRLANQQRENYQSKLAKQIQKVHQILKLQSSYSQTNQSVYINQLQLKLRQLQELIHSENHQKQHFVLEIQKFKKQQQKTEQKNNLLNKQITSLRRESTELNKQNNELKKQIHEATRENHNLNREIHSLKIQNTQLNTELKFTNENQNKLLIQIEELKRTSVSREQFIYLEKQRNKISQELDRAQHERITMLSHEDQKLLANLNSIKEEYLKLEDAYMEKVKQTETLKSQIQKLNEQLQLLDKETISLQNQLNQEKKYTEQLQTKFEEKELKIIELMNVAQSKNAYANKLAQLQQKVSDLQLQLKQKNFLISQLQIQHKKLLHEQKLNENQLKLQLSQLKVQNINFKTSFQQQTKQFNQQIENYQKQLQLKNDQLKQLQKHYNEVNKIDKQMMEKQMKILQNQLFQVIKEKQKLIEETIKIAHLEYQLKQMGQKERNSRKLTENIDHLWLIKETEYQNVNQLLKMFNKKSAQGIPQKQDKV